MSKLTNKLKLYLPGGGSTGLNTPTEQVDIDKINGNFELIDAAIGAVQVSSTMHPAVPYDGLVIRESDTNNTLIYSSDVSKYLPVGVPNCRTDAERDGFYSSPPQGTVVNRIDKGWIEQYYATYNVSTNPQGATPAGWYPVGIFPYLTMDRGAAQPSADNTDVVIKGDAASPGLLGTPRSFEAMTLASDTYSNSLYTWDRVNGILKVKVNGFYDFSAAVQYTVNSQGAISLMLTKNQTTAAGSANMLARMDAPSNPNASPELSFNAQSIKVLTTDSIRLVSRATGQGGTVQMGAVGFPYTAQFSVSLHSLGA